jgi:hypothetical protein
MKPEPFSTIFITATMMQPMLGLKKDEVIKIWTEEKYDYYKIIDIDGNTLILKQLSKDGVLL